MDPRRRLCAFCVVTLIGLIGVVPAAAAEPPGNDNLADATPLSEPAATGTNLEATGEPGEPDHAGESGPLASVWYSWTAPSAGRFRIDTCGSAIDTTLAVYTGAAVDALTEIASAGDDPSEECSPAGVVLFDAQADTTYLIAVDGAGEAQGDVAVNVAPAPLPANDAFASAIAIPGASGADSGSNVDATGETGEPNHADESEPFASLWWTWTAPEDARMRIDTCGSAIDTTLGVYTGDAVDALTFVASNDDDASGVCAPGSVIRIDAQEGTTYRIAVDGFEAEEGDITVNVAPLPVPDNDAFDGAVEIPGAAAQLTGTIVNATGQAGEPDHVGVSAPFASVWFRWTAPASGPVTIDTCGSGFDTTLAVYTGSAVDALTEVASNDDEPELDCGAEATGRESAVTFDAELGVTYAIAVDGYGEEEGELSLQLSGTPPEG